MPNIQSLVRRTQDLGNKVDWWNTAIVFVLVFAALVALFTVLATYMAFKRAKQFADAQGELNTAKEKALADDLDAKALKIEEVKRDAGQANQRAAEANTKAEGFRLDIAKANERAANLESETAAAKLETEKLKQVLAWRIIPASGGADLEKVLSGKPGKVNLRYTDGDPEALFLAIQISQILGRAKWQVAPGSEKFANAIQFGISLPDSAGEDAQTLRSAFVAAKISFSTGPLPPLGASFSVSTIAGAPTLMIGSRAPVNIP